MKFKIDRNTENTGNKRYEIKVYPVFSNKKNYTYSITNEDTAKLMFLILDTPNEPDIKVFRQKVLERLMQPKYSEFAEKTIRNILSNEFFAEEINNLEHSIYELEELYNECADEFFAKQLEFAKLKMSLYDNFKFNTESGFEFPVYIGALSIVLYSVMRYLFDEAIDIWNYREFEGFEDFEMFLIDNSKYAILGVEL